MSRLLVFTLLLVLVSAAPQKKVIDPVKDIKFDHHKEDQRDDVIDLDHHDHAAVDHHDHHDHAAVDHHGYHDDAHHIAQAQYEHKLRHRAQALDEREHALSQHEHALAHHEHALAHHLHAPHRPYPPPPLEKPTSFLLVPLPHAVIPVKPGGLYNPHVKKHAIFVPAGEH